MTAARPRPPFVGWPVQWLLPHGFVWVVPEPLTLVTQSYAETVTVPDTERLHDVFDELLALGIFNGRSGLLIVHDWRTIRAVDLKARDTWLRRAQRPGNPFAITRASYIAIAANPIVKMALQVGALGLQLTLGHPPTSFIRDPATILDENRVLPPPADFMEKVLRGRIRG